MGLSQILVELQEWMGSDRKIAESAWTSSFDNAKKITKTDEDVSRVVKLMAEQGHGTPFESVIFKFWMRIPIFTDRQVVTHRIASHNGLSGRYRTMPNDFYELPKDIETILSKIVYPYDKYRGQSIIDGYREACRETTSLYQGWIDTLKAEQKEGLINNDEFKRVREVLRGVLPISGMTERTSIFNLRSFANYMRHRLSTHAQPEIANVAYKMLEEVKSKNIAPIAIEELEKRQWLLEPTYEIPGIYS